MLLLCLLSAICCMAQKQAVQVFNFSDPQALSPSIEPSDIHTGSVMVTDQVFQEEPISISFSNGSEATGAKIMTEKRDGVPTTYYLRITRTTSMTVCGTGGATLDKVEISDFSTKGDLDLQTGQPGSIEGMVWETENDVDKVSFVNNGIASDIYSLKVYYTTPSDILVPEPDIINGGTIPGFRAINLSFEREMYVEDTEGITISDGGNTYDLTASSDNNVITLSLSTDIEQNGEYTIAIPAHCFKDDEGYYNQKLEYKFTISVPQNTFDYISAVPETGRVEKLSSGIRLEFPGEIADLQEPITLPLKKDGAPYRSVELEKYDTSGNYLIINFSSVASDITENGVYELTIPEGSIYNALKGIPDEERYNPDITLRYVISDEPEPEPEPDPIEIACTLSPGTAVYGTESVELAFSSGDAVMLTDGGQAYFTDAAGVKYDTEITPVEDDDTHFLIATSGLREGEYTLVIPEGVFTVSKDGKNVKIKAIRKSLEITADPEDDFIYNYSFSIYNDKYMDEYVADSYLNSLTIYSYSPMSVDTDKPVYLVRYYDVSDVIRSGVLKSTTIPDKPQVYAFQIVFDTPIGENELRADYYTFIIEKATVGDSNFGKYIDGDGTVKRAECNVNPRLTFTYNVNNDKATRIENVAASQKDTKIYNIMGQHVTSTSAPGIYIVNGRKINIK